MRKLIVILFLFIGISAYADKIYNFDDPIYVSNVNDQVDIKDFYYLVLVIRDNFCHKLINE